MNRRDELIEELLELVPDTKELYAEIKKLANTNKKEPKSSRTFGAVVAEARLISKVYNDNKNSRVDALKDVSLKVHEAEIVALVGPSGSGKSTLLNIFAGLDLPTSGEIIVDGQNLSSLSDSQLSLYRNKKIGFVFQFFYLQPFLDLRTNVEVPLMFSRENVKTRSAYADELIQAVGLGDRIDHLPKELSGGQMQRAAIARALVNKPRLIIADEPTGNLDSKNAKDIMKLFSDIRDQHKTAVLVVTHDSKVASLADRVVELKDGEIS